MSTRVLFVTNSLGEEVNGPVIYSRLLWEYFSNKPDIDFHLLALDVQPRTEHENLHVIPRQEQSRISHLNLGLLGKRAVKLAESLGKQTIVHLNAAHIPYPGPWNRVISNVNDTIVAEGNLVSLFRQYGVKKGASFYLRKSKERTAVHNSRCVMVNSIYTANAVKQAYGDFNNVEVVYKAVECSRFKAVKTARQKMAAVKPDKKVWKLVTVGSNWRYKRLDLLLETLKRLKQTRDDFHLDVYGKTPAAEKVHFRKLAHDMGLADQLSLNDVVSREELANVYEQSDIYVTTSIQEAFGVAVIEALACGLEIVAFAAGGVREILEPPRFCEEVEAGDCDNLAAVLSARMDRQQTPDRIETLHQRATDFDKSVMLQRIDDLYRRFGK
jgi:glycosyltransferase involved in cell wall biosynthesis